MRQPAATTSRSAATHPASEFSVISVQDVHQANWPAGVQRITYRSGVDGREDWATALPRGAGDWIVFIHGHGSRGDQLYVRPDLRDHWLPLFERHRLGILTLNLRGNAWMSPAAAADLHDLLRWAGDRYAMKRRIFVSGSMGGTSNLIYAVLHPEDVDGVVALCPAVDPESYRRWCLEQAGPPVLRDIAAAITASYGVDTDAATWKRHSAIANADRLRMPVYVAHGSADAIIPVSQPRSLAAEMRSVASFRYEELAGGDHEAPLRRAEEGLKWIGGHLSWAKQHDPPAVSP